jgi:DNA polymerase-3 subunit gamma/tau
VSLYQKIRPMTFDGIAGARNKEVVASMRQLAESDAPPHAVLIVGESGCGKTTLGRIYLRALGVADNDYREIDTAEFRGIDTVRELRRAAHYKALGGDRRGWLCDEVHRWTRDAMEGMLKGLEDPPPHAFYVLCTTDPEKLLPTLLSRCVQFRVHPLDDGEMVRLLHRAASSEGAEVSRTTLQKIAEASHGRPRAAINMLQKLIADPDAGADALTAVEQLEAKAIDLYNVMMRDQGWKAARAILSDLKAAGEDPEAIRRSVLGLCASELLRKDSDKAAAIMDEFINPFYDTNFPGLVFAVYSAIRAGQ